ncbi:hypothetical protein OVA11_04195 [Caulobacter sp. SL161]|uniref:hypothetical protein n=1 Tax=Caulobacter sp. SL161 TaxID=2995156 RepID=UPI002275034F|nr:hypothetical protein [Caulobacter sp. SL161]MCY1646296.1 hypothetical protein [Caulobacter sp. SL161]
MTVVRHLSILVLAAVSLAAAPAHAGSERGRHVDPRLSADGAGGGCETRRVTGPGGAYRWERVECGADRGWSDHDRWGYGNAPLAVETQDDRYGARESYAEDRYGPSPGAYGPNYVAAGRDRIGYLIWPGKRP